MMTRSRRSSRYLGVVTRAQLDRAARYDVPARPTTDDKKQDDAEV